MRQRGTRRRNSSGTEGIAYQSKDILSKVFAEHMRDKSFSVYGMHMPKIINALPANFPAVEANELRLDNLFLLEDDSIAIVDYESDYRRKNKLKYLGYIHRVLRRYLKERHEFVRVRVFVIYTADVKPSSTEAVLNAGCLSMYIEEAFLSGLDSEEIRARLEGKITRKESLSKEEMMEFIILPLSYPGKEKKENAVRQAVEWAKRIEDEEVQTFLLSGLLVFSDKVIGKDIAEEIGRSINMLKVEQYFEEQKNKAVRETARRVERETARRVEREMARKVAKETERDKREAARKMARKMFLDGMELSQVIRYVELPRQELERIQAENVN